MRNNTIAALVTAILAMAFSFSVVANDDFDLEVDPYFGYTQADFDAWGEEGDGKGVSAGFWMDNRVALDITYLEGDEVEIYQLNIIGAILSGYNQRLTWHIGANRAEASNFDEHDSYMSWGLGYELDIGRHLTLRAMYSVLELDDDNGTDDPKSVSVSLLGSF